jgi:hypothetical protein
MNPPPGRSSCHGRFPRAEAFGRSLDRRLAAPGWGGFVRCAVRPRWSGLELKEKEFIMSQPAHKIRNGVLQVTIWRNPTEKGVWYSVVPTRSYKNGDDIWKTTDSLGFDDLLAMAKLFDQAHSWILSQQQADAKARKEAEQAEDLESGQAAA